MKKSTPDNIDDIFRDKFSEFEVDPFPDSKEKIFTDFFSEELKYKKNKKPLIVLNYKYAVAATLAGLFLFIGIYYGIRFGAEKNDVAINRVNENLELNKEHNSLPAKSDKLIKIETSDSVKLKSQKDEIIANPTLNSSKEVLVCHRSEMGKLEFYLPDSSKVFLNKNSVVTYANDFITNERVVNISGDVYFDVKKMNKKKFVVNTALSKIEVLGTSFCVTSFNDGSEQVIVESGKVLFSERLNPEKNKVFLTPGMKAILISGKPIVAIDGYQPNDLFWKNNKLTFHKTLIKNVIRDVENAFQLKINLSDEKINNCHFTGSFDYTASVDEILSTISLSLNGSYEIKNRVCTLYGKGCN